jgi:hypothetical protein
MPAVWIWAGPLQPRSLETDFLAGLGGAAKAWPAPGATAAHESSKATFARLDPKHFWKDGKFTAGMESMNLAGLANEGAGAQAGGAGGTDAKGNKVQGDKGSTILLFTTLEFEAPKFVEFRLMTPGGAVWNTPARLQAKAWLGGKEIQEGTTYQLEKGRYPFLIQAGLGTCEKGGKIWIAPRLVDKGTGFTRKQAEYEKARKVWETYKAQAEKPFVLQP